MTPTMQHWLVDVPAKIVDGLWFGYWLLIAAGSLVCLTTVAIILVLYQFGIRLWW